MDRSQTRRDILAKTLRLSAIAAAGSSPAPAAPALGERPLFTEIVGGLASNPPAQWAVEYLRKLRLAYARMRENRDGLSLADQAELHRRQTISSVHKSPAFLPWHRGMLLFHERILGALIGDPNFRIPVWDWESADGINPPRFITEQPASANSLYVPRLLLKDKTPLAQKIIVKWRSLLGMDLPSFAGGYQGILWREGDRPPSGTLVGLIASAPHNIFHTWVGEVMGKLGTSGHDPLFYMHHCGIDRIWAHRQILRTRTGVQDYLDLPDNHYIKTRDLSFVDYVAGAAGGVLRPTDVTMQIKDFADFTTLGYSYKFPAITARQTILRPLSFVGTGPPWKRDSATGSNRFPVRLGVEFPSQLSGEIRMSVSIDERWKYIGSWLLVGHGHSHRQNATERVAMYVDGTIKRKDLVWLSQRENIIGRWELGKEAGEMRIFELSLVEQTSR